MGELRSFDDEKVILCMQEKDFSFKVVDGNYPGLGTLTFSFTFSHDLVSHHILGDTLHLCVSCSNNVAGSTCALL